MFWYFIHLGSDCVKRMPVAMVTVASGSWIVAAAVLSMF